MDTTDTKKLRFAWEFGRERFADRPSFDAAYTEFNSDRTGVDVRQLHRAVSPASSCSVVYSVLDETRLEYEEKLAVVQVPEGHLVQLGDVIWQVGEAGFDSWEETPHRFAELLWPITRRAALDEYARFPALAEVLKATPEPIFQLACGS